MTVGRPAVAIHWSHSTVTRRHRWRALGVHGATVWLTGISGSGKSSIAKHMESDLVNSGIPAYVLDGDNLRHGVNGDLGFSRKDRGENARRAAEIAKLLADAGLVVVVALISPYAEDRARARLLHDEVELPFLEVHVNAPQAVCEARDPKGLYAQARTGAIGEFTTVSDPYEVPERPDLVVSTDEGTVEDAAHAVLDALRARLERGAPSSA